MNNVRTFTEGQKKSLENAHLLDFESHVLILKGAFLSVEPENWEGTTEDEWRLLAARLRGSRS